MNKILLIEPDTRLAALYISALNKVEKNVDHVTTAQDGLLRLDAEPYNLIIMEIDMPDHNGFEFLYEFCSYEDWVSIPIYIHSSLPKDRYSAMMVDWSELGVVDYLYKPDTSLANLQSLVFDYQKVS